MLPATHGLAGRDVVDLASLAALPLRIVSRRPNQPLVDLVMSACAAAGFAPILGTHLDTLENNVAAIAAGPASWTVIYEAHARALLPQRAGATAP